MSSTPPASQRRRPSPYRTPPTIALTATPSTTTVGTAVALKATVSSSAGTPTGTVYFMDGTNMLGSAVLSAGSASYSATALGVGSHSITARYSGDSNFAGLTSTAQTVTINLITPTVALTATPTTAQIGTAIALSATVSGSGATPTGMVTFLDGTTTLAKVNLTNGAGAYSATALAVGMHSITASYSGDGSFSPLVSSAQTVTITAVPPTISAAFSPASLTITHGSTSSSTLTVTPANGFVGTLTFSCGSLPSSASCGFAPSSLIFTAASSTPQSTVITVSTNASIIGALQPSPFRPRGWSSTGAVFAALLLLPLAVTRRSRNLLRKRSFLTLGALLLSLRAERHLRLWRPRRACRSIHNAYRQLHALVSRLTELQPPLRSTSPSPCSSVVRNGGHPARESSVDSNLAINFLPPEGNGAPAQGFSVPLYSPPE